MKIDKNVIKLSYNMYNLKKHNSNNYFTFILFLILLVIICKSLKPQSYIPYAETIKGKVVKSNDSANAIIIFAKGFVCHSCYEILGDFISQFIPKSTYGLTYWINEESNIGSKRLTSDYINNLVGIEGQKVFFSKKLKDNEIAINNKFNIKEHIKTCDYPAVMIINTEQKFMAFYKAQDILTSSTTIKESFAQDFDNFMKSNNKAILINKKMNKKSNKFKN